METTTRTYRVSGMTCGHCVASVTRELEALDAVTDVQVELSTGEVTVRSGRPLDDAEVAAAIDEAGYELGA